METIKTFFKNIDEKQVDEDAKNVTFISTAKQIAIFLIGFLGIYAISIISEFVIVFAMGIINGTDSLMNLAENNMFLLGMELVAYLLTLLAILLTINSEWKKLFINIKNPKSYICGLCCSFGVIGFEIIYSTILAACGYELATGGNQGDINQIASASTAISILLFGIIGPVTEELTYRVGLYSLLRRKNKILAYLVTSFIFGFIHVMSHLADGNLINELALLPIYVGSGFLLTYTYEKYGFVGSVIAHIFVNLVSLI